MGGARKGRRAAVCLKILSELLENCQEDKQQTPFSLFMLWHIIGALSNEINSTNNCIANLVRHRSQLFSHSFLPMAEWIALSSYSMSDRVKQWFYVMLDYIDIQSYTGKDKFQRKRKTKNNTPGTVRKICGNRFFLSWGSIILYQSQKLFC